MADRSSRRPTAPSNRGFRVVFVHIPKTAGTTLNRIMRSNATHLARLANVFKGGGGRVVAPSYTRMVAKMEETDADFFWGHTPFAIASYLPEEWDARFFTFLRDPVDRAISQYYGMLRGFDPDDQDDVDGDEDEDDDDATRGSSRKGGAALRGQLTPDVPYDVALSDGAFISDNLQTRMLCGLPRPFGNVTDEMLERAIANLRQFRCIGLTERFDESLVLLKHRIGYANILYDDQRVNSSRPRDEGVPEGLRAAAERANRFDRELYRHAVEIFESTPELTEPSYRHDLETLRTTRSAVREARLELVELEARMDELVAKLESWGFSRQAPGSRRAARVARSLGDEGAAAPRKRRHRRARSSEAVDPEVRSAHPKIKQKQVRKANASSNSKKTPGRARATGQDGEPSHGSGDLS